MFVYIIGGEEVSCYPINSKDCPSPPTDRREEFFDFLLKGNRAFLSLESLRALKVKKLINPKITWEENLMSIFSADICGLLSGGVVNKSLELLPWKI